jgi:hypothetical protein
MPLDLELLTDNLEAKHIAVLVALHRIAKRNAVDDATHKALDKQIAKITAAAEKLIFPGGITFNDMVSQARIQS